MMSSSLRAAPALQRSRFIVPLNNATRLELVGGKAHNLCRVSELGLRVPDGFVSTTRAFEAHLEENALPIKHARSRDLIVNTSLSPKLRELLRAAAAELLNRGPVVVRSSAV